MSFAFMIMKLIRIF